MKNRIRLFAIATLILGMAVVLPPLVTRTAQARSFEHQDDGIRSLSSMVSKPNSARPVVGLDARRRFALGMIETANNDSEIGGAGEVSRYQIMPSVWKHYSNSQHYRDPDVSLEVARQHWTALFAAFKKQANREPSDFDMYVLWNTRAGYYARKGFKPARLDEVVRDRAQRFVNLVERGSL